MLLVCMQPCARALHCGERAIKAGKPLSGYKISEVVQLDQRADQSAQVTVHKVALCRRPVPRL